MLTFCRNGEWEREIIKEGTHARMSVTVGLCVLAHPLRIARITATTSAISHQHAQAHEIWESKDGHHNCSMKTMDKVTDAQALAQRIKAGSVSSIQTTLHIIS